MRLRKIQTKAMAGAVMLACGLTSPARAAELDSSNLKLLVTTGASQFGFQVINTTTNTTVLSSSSTSFGSSAVTGASVVSSGTNFVNLSFSLQGGGTATGQFTILAPTQVQVNLTGPAGTSAISQMFTDLNQGNSTTPENYYGAFSQTFNGATNLVDNGLTNQIYDGNYQSVGSVSTDGARAPFYFTSNNVGVYTPTENIGSYTFGNGTAGKTTTGFTFNTTNGTGTNASLGFDVMVGNSPKGVLSQFTGTAGLAGTTFMPPTWAFDSIWWRQNFNSIPAAATAAGVTNAQGLVLADAANLLKYNIPASALWIDRQRGSGPTNGNTVEKWGNMDFNTSQFPDAAATGATSMEGQLQSAGLSLMLWTANRAQNNMLTIGQAGTPLAGSSDNGFLFTQAEGDTSAGVSAPAYDLLNPAAYSSFVSQMSSLLTSSANNYNDEIKGFKIDRGGEGEMPLQMTNQIPVLMDQLAAQVQAQQNGSNSFNFARDVPDTARQYAAVWNGDSAATFAGLSTSVQNGLLAGLIGDPMWGSDSGGYSSSPTGVLFARWLEFSAYCPMMEVPNGVPVETSSSGTAASTGHNVWYDYSGSDPALVGIASAQTQVHHSLIPYVQSCMAESMQDGVPIMRALMLEFPGDSNVANTWNQYMYGPNILVAPVLSAGSTSSSTLGTVSSMSVYLPAGARWVEYDGESQIAGSSLVPLAPALAGSSAGGTVTLINVPQGTIPTFVREGAIIPRGDILQDNLTVSDSNWTPTLTLDLFPSDRIASSFDYYTATGSSTQTTQESGAMVMIQSSITSNVLDIECGDLGVAGDMNIYLGRFCAFAGIYSVTMNGQALNGYSYDATDEILTVPFTGAVNLAVDLSSVPEPAMIGLLGMSVAALTLRPRRYGASLLLGGADELPMP